MIILQLMSKNNTPTNLRVIFNRGNHEDVQIYMTNGFFMEMSNKIPKKEFQKFHSYILHFFTYLSSAIILTNVDTNYNYWLSHGGVPILEDKIYKLQSFTSDETVINYPKDVAQQIRWNDFYNDNVNSCNFSRGCKCNGIDGCFVISPKYAVSFMSKNNIQFIIRGHQDSTANFYVLSSLSPNSGALIVDEIAYLESNSNIYMNTKDRANIKNRNAVHGPISRVNIDALKWKDNKIKGIIPTLNTDKIDVDIYPIITISTNTDYGRPLVHDSFGIIRFDLNQSTAEDFSENVNILDTRK